MRISPASRHVRGIDLTLRAVAVATLVLLGAILLRDVLLLIFAAVLAACVLRGAAVWLHARIGIGTGWCLALVLVSLMMLIIGGLWLQGAHVTAQAASVADAVTQQVKNLWERWQDNPLVQRLMPRLKDEAGSMVGSFTSAVPGVASSVIGVGGDLVVIFATAIFLAVAPETYASGFLRLFPVPWRSRGQEIMQELGSTLQLWFLGQFADMLVVTALTGAGLFALGVPLAPTLALIAGLFNFVPYIGALAGAVPALAVAVAQSPQTALYVGILFAVVQTLEGNVIAPLIQKRTVDLPPALTILSQTILGALFGVMGLILATPLTAAVMVAVRMVYIEDVLESESAGQARDVDDAVMLPAQDRRAGRIMPR
jgi:predicted PurR-regulated permease PerM